MTGPPLGKSGSLGASLAEAVRAARGGVVEVEENGVSVRARVNGAGPYGAGVQELELRCAGPTRDQPGQAERLAALRVLPERLKVLEVDADRGEILARTRPQEVRQKTWFEARVEPGRLRLRRLRHDDATTTRRVQEMPFTYDSLGRVAEGLAEVLRPDDGEP